MSAGTVLLVAVALAGAGEPLVYEVPRGGPSLAAQRRAPFTAAPLRVGGGRVVRGAWRSSDEILGPGSTHVVVVATWCPACRELLARVAREPGRGPVVILFLEDEVPRRDSREPRARAAAAGDEATLWNPAVLEGFPREVWLLRSGSRLERLVTHYPFHLVCTRDACRAAR